MTFKTGLGLGPDLCLIISRHAREFFLSFYFEALPGGSPGFLLAIFSHIAPGGSQRDHNVVLGLPHARQAL